MILCSLSSLLSGMFTNPMLLGGLVLIAIPIVLHFLMRQRPRRIEFPALRFIRKASETTQRRMLLRHILLLILRVLAILLLVLLLSRPKPLTLHWGILGDQEGPVAAALVVDTSARMEYQQDNVTRLQAARRIGLEMLQSLPDGSEVAVCDTRPGPKAFGVDRDAARTRLEKLGIASDSQPVLDTATQAARLLTESDLSRRELFIFTDMAAAAWPPTSAARFRAQLEATEPVTVYVVDIGAKRPINDAIGPLKLSDDVLSAGQTLRIKTDVSRIAPEGSPPNQRVVRLELIDEDNQPIDETPADEAGNQSSQRIQRDQVTVNLQANTSVEVELTLGALTRGTHQGVVRFDGTDGLPADDERLFTVEVMPPARVLVIAPDVPSRRALYVTEALAPTPLRLRGEARFDCTVIGFDELPSQEYSKYQGVLLLDPPALEPQQWRDLGDYVARGGGLGLFLGREADIESLTEKSARDFLPAVPVRQARAPDGDVYLAPEGFSHPVLALFQPLADAIPWEGFPVFRYWQLQPNAGGTTIVRLSNESPVIVERLVGKGRVLMMATPMSDPLDQSAWNLLPAGEAWPTVMLTVQMANYLVGSLDLRLNYQPGEPVSIPAGSKEIEGPYQLFAPDGLNFPISIDAATQRIEFSATEQVGNYRIEAGGTTGVQRGFSVNYAPAQTELQPLEPDGLDAVFGEVPYKLANSREKLERDMQPGGFTIYWFNYLIVLMIIALALEYIVANLFYRRSR